MNQKVIRIDGNLLGFRTDPASGAVAEIVAITRESRPRGPAEHALIRVEVDGGGRRGRYISWINYGDLDEASAAETGAWTLVEPATPWSQNVVWTPFGTPPPATGPAGTAAS